MHTNLSFGEGIIRIFISIIWGAIFGSGALGVYLMPVGILAVVPLVTGMAGYCPIRQALGKESCTTPSPQDSSEKA